MDIFKICTYREIFAMKLILAGVAKDTDDAGLAWNCNCLINQIETEQMKWLADGRSPGVNEDGKFDLLKEQQELKSVTGIGGPFLPVGKDENYEIANWLIDKYLHK